jgi:polysaccharide export outer membrane protein
MSYTMRRPWRLVPGFLVLVTCTLNVGCMTCKPEPCICASPLPRELNKVTMPNYVIEAPDILLIDALRVVPKPPYKIDTLDALLITATNTLPTEPISGVYVVDPEGTVNLGLSYGTARVIGMTIPQAKEEILRVLKAKLRDPEVNVSLAYTRGQQQIRGDHLVRPDGSVSLGLYGSVRVTGLTLPEAKAAIEAQLSQYLEKPEVSVDIFAYNSKVFYVIYDLGGNGQTVARLPITGNETVLDAVANLSGLSAVAATHNVYVARPAPACNGCDQMLPVDWNGIVRRGETATNYQLLPGDRVFVGADPFITLDTRLGRLLNPIERIFGFILLGNSTIVNLRDPASTGANNAAGSGAGGF